MEYAAALSHLPAEAVETNQKALIDKVLARYSGENTVFRELLQNADDATATQVEIKFLSQPTPTAPTLDPSSATPNLPNLATHPVQRITTRNDGMPFRTQDWARLRKIAEGNPDESKIGAFGVGFYSLWSICDAPVVLSGDEMMAFSWSEKNPDQLVTRRGVNPNAGKDLTDEGKPWTTFVMDLRQTAPMPAPHEFSRFLATSLAFTTSIRTIKLYLDSHLLCSLTKQLAPPKALNPARGLDLRSPKKMMTIKSVDQTGVQIDAKVLRWTLQGASAGTVTKSKAVAKATASATSSFAAKMLSAFSPSSINSPPTSRQPSPIDPTEDAKDPLATLSASLFLRVVTGNVSVDVSKSFSSELERATKKPPPKQTKVELVWTGKDEWDASQGSESGGNSGAGKTKILTGDDRARSVFSGLLSSLSTQGRIFIGFATHQSAGTAASVAARFIPTVERESLDLQASHVKEWNLELLYTVGCLKRVCLEGEMREVAELWKEVVKPTNIQRGDGQVVAKPEEDPARDWLLGRCLHAMLFFTFHSSTPSSAVAIETERGFFGCSKESLTITSTEGPMSAWNVRLPNPELAPFLKQIPLVPVEAAKEASVLLDKLKERRMVRDITFDDVFGELEKRALEVEEMKACMGWSTGLSRMRGYDPSLVGRLKGSAMVRVVGVGKDGERIMPLSLAKTYLNPKTIPSDLPLPEHTLPFELTKSLKFDDLSRVFGYNELSVLEWLQHLFSPSLTGPSAPVTTNLLSSPAFAESVLNVLAKQWTSIPAGKQSEVATLMKEHPCVPTRHGMKKPEEAYHSNVTLFQDLAVVILPSGSAVKGPLEKMLTGLGVRKHVELQLVFSRLLGSGDWSHVDLTKYLVSVRDILTDTEIDRLRNTRWLPKDGEAKAPVSSTRDGPKKLKTIRYNARDLYEPTDALRGLGLPLVEWPGKWRSSSDEAKLLLYLGVVKTPPATAVLAIAANSEDSTLRNRALAYFLEHFQTAGYSNYRLDASTPAFVPVVLPDGKRGLAKPSECYASKDAATLGFSVIQDELRVEAVKLQVRDHPPSAAILSTVINKPASDVIAARKVFAYLSSRVSSLSNAELTLLKSAPIIPVTKEGKTTLIPPLGCYFLSQAGESSLATQFRTLFTFVEFGPAAVPFLTAVGGRSFQIDLGLEDNKTETLAIFTVKTEPAMQEVCAMLIKDPPRFYQLAGSAEAYTMVLRNIAANQDLLPSSLRSAMKQSAFFLGSRRAPSSSTPAPAPTPKLIELDDEDEDEMDTGAPYVYVLSKPSDIVIIDDPHAHVPFASVILACPQEDTLESLVEALGAPRLSRLIRETYDPAGPVPGTTPRTTDVFKLVVERTSLFLHERHYASRNEVLRDAEWLKKHLTVTEVTSLSMKREIQYGGRLHSSAQMASATAVMRTSSSMVLYISKQTEMDWFEVATGLCRLILAKLRLNDSLLLMTILMTSLKNLRRRGMNVDKIINARKAEKEAVAQRERERKLQMQLEEANALSPERAADYQRQLEGSYPDADPQYIASLLEQQNDDHLQRATKALLSGNYPRRPKPVQAAPPARPHSSISDYAPSGGLLGNFKRRFLNGASSSAGPSSPDENTPPPERPNSQLVPAGGPQPKDETSPPDPRAQATPMSDIRSNLLKAISASRPDSNPNLQSKSGMKSVKESESSYCDPSGADTDLIYTTSISGMRFYVDRKVPNAETIVGEYGAQLRRYVDLIILPVGIVFDLDPRSLHVFYDLEGPLIAFNRGGSLFFNLRYYMSWYDSRVANNDLADALIGTFSSCAHELAHNLHQAHDSAHEFWMSSFIEQYFLRLAVYIGQVQSSATPPPSTTRQIENA